MSIQDAKTCAAFYISFNLLKINFSYIVSGFEQSVKMTPNDYLIGAELASETHLGIEALLPFHSFFFHLQLDPAFLMGLSLPISCSHSAPLAGYFLFTLCPVCCLGWWGFFVWCIGWFCVCMCLPSHGILRLLSSAG